MALESFYGGKPGFSPVIKARFKYINDEDPAYQDALTNGSDTATLKEYTMDECFKDVNYTDVWYGELCIIDAENKMNPNNGKLYRRTLKKLNDDRWTSAGNTTYAEYIGQIVGPSGGVPNLDLGSLNGERLKAIGQAKTYDTDSEEMSNVNWDYAYPDKETGMMTNRNPGGDYEEIKVLDAGGINGQNIEMVPGKDGDTYHDTIKYTWCNVRRTLDNSGEDAWIYLGFQIPYTVFETTDHQENYTYNGSIFIDNSDPNRHPFYKNYAFHIPRGARGIGPEELFVVGKNDRSIPTGSVLYPFDSIKYQQNPKEDSVEDIYEVDIKDKSDWYYIPKGTQPVTPTEKTYWVAKWTLYNPKTTEAQAFYLYIGSYKDITKVRLQDNGQLDIQYSNSDDWINLNTLTWITSVNVNTNDTDINYGQFQINFNNNKISDIDTNLHLIHDMNYNDRTGEFTFNYSGDVTKIVGVVEYIKSLAIDTNNNINNNNYGKVTGITNLDNSSIITTLPLIKNVIYNDSTGEFTFNYSGEIDPQTVGTISYISKMRFINDTNNPENNGVIQYQLNNSNTWTDIKDDNNISLKLKDIKNVELLKNGHLKIIYRDGTFEDVGLVRGNAIAGVVYTLKNAANAEDQSFNDEMDALNALQNSIFQDSDSTTIGGNRDGRIKVNEEDVTGGLVSAKIKQIEGTSKKIYSVIFYYDVQSESWINAGSIGNSDGGNKTNVYIIGTKIEQYSQDDAGYWPGQLDDHDYTTPYGQQYPSKQNNNPEIYFIDTRQISQVESTSIYEPGGYKEEKEIIIFPYDDPPMSNESTNNEP